MPPNLSNMKPPPIAIPRVYCFHIHANIYKIGFTEKENLLERQKELERDLKLKLKLIYLKRCTTITARNAEHYVQYKLQKYHIKPRPEFAYKTEIYQAPLYEIKKAFDSFDGIYEEEGYWENDMEDITSKNNNNNHNQLVS